MIRSGMGSTDTTTTSILASLSLSSRLTQISSQGFFLRVLILCSFGSEICSRLGTYRFILSFFVCITSLSLLHRDDDVAGRIIKEDNYVRALSSSVQIWRPKFAFFLALTDVYIDMNLNGAWIEI